MKTLKNTQNYNDDLSEIIAKGKKITLIIIIVNLILAVIVSVFIEFSFFDILYSIMINYLLYCGYKLVRYLHIFGGFAAFVIGIFTLPDIIGIASSFYVAYYIALIIYSLASAIILIKSTSVIEFLYLQRKARPTFRKNKG